MTTAINVTFEDETFERLDDAKDELELTWENLIVQGTELLAETNEIEMK